MAEDAGGGGHARGVCSHFFRCAPPFRGTEAPEAARYGQDISITAAASLFFSDGGGAGVGVGIHNAKMFLILTKSVKNKTLYNRGAVVNRWEQRRTPPAEGPGP